MGAMLIIKGAHLASTATNPRVPDPLPEIGMTGLTHRWEASQITVPEGAAVTSFPDVVGGAHLTPASTAGSRTFQKANGIPFVAITGAGPVQMQTTAATDVKQTSYTAAIVARMPGSPNSIVQLGPVTLYQQGNGAFLVLDTGAQTGHYLGTLDKTKFHTFVVSVSGSTIAVSVDGIETLGAAQSGGAWTGASTATTVRSGSNLTASDSSHLALVAFKPAVTDSAGRRAIYDAIKAAYPTLP